MTSRNKLFAHITNNPSFTFTQGKNALTKTIRQFEAEGLISITDISGPYGDHWRIDRLF